ncbi:MAG: NAD(P)H-dependent oxidoreductase [Chitinophagaceae bacterium]|nr:NAD(P)H-dependent oxidoreductase [Chitinophagaceae bacterium]
MQKFQLKIVITSTRNERKGMAVADWFIEKAKANESFNTEVLDLKSIDLPMLDEPNHPKLQQYQYEHTRAWSKTVAEGDAFVFIIPEYNYGLPPAMVNAVDYLFHEWMYKPAALVSYGGISAGLRSAQMSKLILTTVKMVPLTEAVSIPFFANHINENGVFVSNPSIDNAYNIMMAELEKWTKGLKYMREHFV